MSVYDPLKNYLLSKKGSKLVHLTFTQFDSIAPNKALSKYDVPQWWENDDKTHPQAHAWMTAGWKKKDVDLNRQIVTFMEV